MSDESDWSDSEEGSDQLQTSVLLGLPDGEILDPKDLRDPNVSRLGGKPVRPCACFQWVHIACTHAPLCVIFALHVPYIDPAMRITRPFSWRLSALSLE
jgi:hypothetical protein